jgi:hypothetical protein
LCSGAFGVEDKEAFHFQWEAEVDSRTIFATGLEGESNTSDVFRRTVGDFGKVDILGRLKD